MLCTITYGQKNNLSGGFKLKLVTIYYLFVVSVVRILWIYHFSCEIRYLFFLSCYYCLSNSLNWVNSEPHKIKTIKLKEFEAWRLVNNGGLIRNRKESERERERENKREISGKIIVYYRNTINAYSLLSHEWYGGSH